MPTSFARVSQNGGSELVVAVQPSRSRLHSAENAELEEVRLHEDSADVEGDLELELKEDDSEQQDKRQNEAESITLSIPIVPSDSPPAPAAPVKQYSMNSLILLFLVVIADGIALHIIVPFISVMAEERFSIAPEAVGAAAGVLLGSFSMAVLFSSFILGHLSDLCQCR